VLNVVLGNLLIKPWYPSFYPEDLVGKVVNRLYVCQSCFRYSKELMPYLAHMVRGLRETVSSRKVLVKVVKMLMLEDISRKYVGLMNRLPQAPPYTALPSTRYTRWTARNTRYDLVVQCCFSLPHDTRKHMHARTQRLT